MKTKRTKSKYVERVVLKIIRHNQSVKDECEFQKEIHLSAKQTFNKMFGSSFLNSLSTWDNDWIYDAMINLNANYYKLSRLKRG